MELPPPVTLRKARLVCLARPRRALYSRGNNRAIACGAVIPDLHWIAIAALDFCKIAIKNSLTIFD
jgi:hypothetical protein